MQTDIHAIGSERSAESDATGQLEETNGGGWPHMLEQLKLPFLPEIVSWKPQTVSRDRRRCLAVPYVETQPYQERLDAICPDWQDDYAIWFSDPQEIAGRMGDKRAIPGKVFVKCRLTIAEHTRADVGECDLTDENAFTSAKAQAFKRACASFGLGRYLYDLPTVWVDFDEDKGIPESELRKLEFALRRRMSANGNAAGAGRGAGATNGNGHVAPANGNGHASVGADVGSSSKENGQQQSVSSEHATARAGADERAPANGRGQVDAASTGAVTAPAKEAGSTNRPANGSATRALNSRVRGGTVSSSRAPAATNGGGSTAAAQAVAAPARSVAAAAAALDAAVDAPNATDEQPLCPLHHVPLQLIITRDGKTHLLHKIEGEGYCNGEMVRPLRQN
jgi:hypothetical protein